MPSKENKTETGIIHESNRKLYQLLVVAIVLLIALAAMGYWLVENYEPTPVATETEVTTATDSTILFTAYNEEQGLTVYALDLTAENALPQRISPLAISSFVEFKDQENPDGFFFTGITELSSEGDDVVGIHSYALSSETDSQLQYYSGSAGYSESNLEWSEAAQLLAFESGSTEESGDNIEGRYVVMFDPAANEVVRTFVNAVQPHWSPDGTKLLFMREDGFYVYDREIQEEQRVLVEDSNTDLALNIQTTLSQDGSVLVITGPGANLTVIEIQAWEPFSFTVSDSLTVPDVLIYQPLLSPDGSMVATVALDVIATGDTDTTQELANPRLEIRSIKNIEEVIFSHQLDSYDVTNLHLDDWVQVSATELSF